MRSAARSLHEVTLHESIRYGQGDHVEKWLNELLCLDCLSVPRIISGCPLPQTCDLYPLKVDIDIKSLFFGHNYDILSLNFDFFFIFLTFFRTFFSYVGCLSVFHMILFTVITTRPVKTCLISQNNRKLCVNISRLL